MSNGGTGGETFLERDFNQCFDQIRHYDGQIWDICKFTFTGFAAIIGVSIGLFQYSIEKYVNLIPAAIAVLIVGIILGIFMLYLGLRNRVYFVIFSRYINEHRRHFISHKPLGFENATGMFADPSKPPYFDWRSSQLWFLNVICALNSALIAALLYFSSYCYNLSWIWYLLSFFILFAIQFYISMRYLKSRADKSAGPALFGNN